MTELKMVIEDSNLISIEQTLKNEKDFSDIQFQNELDLYINEYITNFNKENFKDGIHLNSIKIYYDDVLVRNVQKNNV
jgi:hypothetical protein